MDKRWLLLGTALAGAAALWAAQQDTPAPAPIELSRPVATPPAKDDRDVWNRLRQDALRP